jgi:hypothetical protein
MVDLSELILNVMLMKDIDDEQEGNKPDKGEPDAIRKSYIDSYNAHDHSTDNSHDDIPFK